MSAVGVLPSVGTLDTEAEVAGVWQQRGQQQGKQQSQQRQQRQHRQQLMEAKAKAETDQRRSAAAVLSHPASPLLAVPLMAFAVLSARQRRRSMRLR